MTTRHFVAALLMLAAAPVLASDVSTDQRDQAAPLPKCTCTCSCACRHETKEPAGQAQPQVDYGETATWPPN